MRYIIIIEKICYMIYTKYVDLYFIIYYIYVSNVYVIKYSVVPFVFEATPLSFGVQSQ